MDKKEQYEAILKEHGLKVTSQRMMVLEVLGSCPDRHLTAEEIYDLVKARLPKIGLATVYRTIQLLSELHIVDRINLDDGFVRYEIGHGKAGESGHHPHHLVCLNCGSVVSFQDDLLEELETKIKETTGFKVVDHEVKLYGYCKECGGNLIENKTTE